MLSSICGMILPHLIKRKLSGGRSVEIDFGTLNLSYVYFCRPWTLKLLNATMMLEKLIGQQFLAL